MTSNATEHHGEQVIKKYESYGSLYGFGLGLIGAVLITGPHFQDWSVLKCLLFIFGGTAIGTFVGYILPKLSLGFAAGANTGGLSENRENHELLSSHNDCSSSNTDGGSSACSND